MAVNNSPLFIPGGPSKAVMRDARVMGRKTNMLNSVGLVLACNGASGRRMIGRTAVGGGLRLSVIGKLALRLDRTCHFSRRFKRCHCGGTPCSSRRNIVS